MLSAETQIRYLLQWFQEWNDFQRTDFLPVMIEKYSNIYQVNGISSDEETDDKPLSLFECRVSISKILLTTFKTSHILGEIVQRMVCAVEYRTQRRFSSTTQGNR